MNDVDEDLKRLRIVVSGRVQGVWYRGSMAREAERLGVAGWVKNRPDGTVEAAVEGPCDRLARIVAWCEKGPSGARVDNVVTHEEPPEGLVGFDVAY